MLAAEISTTRPTRTLWVRAAVVAVISLIAAMLGFASPTYAASGPATFVSDQADYPPGGTVVLTGDNWASGESVHITVNDDAGQTWSLSSGTGTAPADPVANDTGSFSYTFSLPAWFVANYTATATGATTGTLTTTFTDSAIQKFDQCANNFGDGYPATNADPGCQWINGNLNEGNANNPNATYNEGDSTIQRIALDGLAAGQSYTLIFTYDTTKSSKHAYDYLTTYNASETWVTGPDLCQSITGGCSLSGASTFPIPDDPNQTFDSGTRNYTMSGGTLTAASGVFPSAYAGDTVASMSVTFTATNATSVLWFGAHVASQLDWGNGNGAGSVSGSPYHVSVKSLNGASLGNQDNQMSAGAVLTAGTVTIIKDAVPNSAQDFSFTLTNGATSSKTFSLDDDSDATLPNTVTYNVAPGTWTLTENATVSPWSMTNLTCTGGTYAVSGSTATLTVLSGKTITCTYTNNFIYKNLEVTKTAVASYDRSYTWTIAKSVDKTTVNTTSGSPATFNYVVTATPTAHDSNFKVSGTITVTNPNTVPVPAVTLADSMTDGTCSITGTTSNITVAAGGTVTFPYNCTFTSKPTGTQTNTATATWTAGSPFGTSGSASGTATANFANATVTVSGKTVQVTDDKTDPAHPVVLGTADATIPTSQSFTYSLAKSAPQGGCADYTNNAWLATDPTHPASQTVRVCGGAALSISKTATPAYTRTWTWTVDKVGPTTQLIADPSNGDVTAHYTVTASATSTDSDWTVSGTIHIANPNSVAVPITSVTDAISGGSATPNCVITDPVPSSLAANDSVDLAYTCTYATNPGTGTLTNTATVNYGASGFVAAGSASVSVTTTFGGLLPATQTGDTTTVSDPNAPEGTFPASVAAPGGSWSYDVTWNVGTAGTCQPFTNTATLGTGASDSADVTACRAADLAVTKTATGSYDTTYLWDVSKTLDASVPGSAPAGTTVPLPYAVVATKIGQTDAAWVIKGTITVTNPNTWEPVTLQSVSDSLSVDGATCTISGDQTATIAAGATAIFDYTCSYASKPASYSGTNTATVTWDKPAAHTATGSARGAADYTMALTKETDKTVTVVDTFNGGDPVQVGTADISESPKTLPVDRSIALPSGTCVKVTNIATITGDAGTTLDTASVDKTICGGANLTVTKTADAGYTQTYPWTVTKDASRTKIVVAEGGNTDVTYTVTPTVGTPTPTAWTLTGQITVSNPNDWETVTVDITDAVNIDGLTCTVLDGNGVVIPKATGATPGTATRTYSCTVAGGADPGTLSGTNTATATWNADAASTSAGSAFGTAGVTGTLTGSINETVHVTDSMFGGELGTADADGTLTATGAGVTVVDGSFVYTKTLTGTPGQCQTIHNTATITETSSTDSADVSLCIVKALTATKSGEGTFTRTYPWSITKDVDRTEIDIAPDGTATFHYTVTATQGTPVDSAWALSGTITVTNPNAFPATAIVTDNLSECTVTGSPVTVAANGTADLAYRCTGLTSAVTANSASVTWTATTDAGALTGDTTADGSGFLYTETNPVDKDIAVWDDETVEGAENYLGTAEWGDGITPVTFRYDVTKSGADIAPGQCATYDNKAWVKTGANDSSDTQQVKVCVGADLLVTKTATGSYDTTYLWKIEKSTGEYAGNTTAGTVVTVPYTVTATNTGQTDANWMVVGKITVTNPNTWESVTLQSVSDSLSVDGASCVVTGDQNQTIAAKGSAGFDYTCTYATQPDSYSGTNRATVTWAKDLAYTANGEASGSADYTLALNGKTFDTITVTDTYEGVTTTLGTAMITDSPKDFTYSHDVTAPSGSCTTVHNTATISETGASASASATVCGAAGITTSKTASGAFDRDWTWKVVKDAEKTDLVADPTTGKVTATYTVTVTPTATDSGATVKGTITAHNPNDVPLTVSVSDAIGDTTCTVDPATGTMPANGDFTATYTCSLPQVPTGDVTNVATVTWEGNSYVPAGSAYPQAHVDFALVKPVVSGDGVTVTDGYAPEGTFGTYFGADGEQAVKYDVTWIGEPGTCVDYTNRATLSSGAWDEATVNVCFEAPVTATKSMTASYSRDYDWTLKKTVDTNQIDTTSGANATFTYTVTATPTVTDSGFAATGAIVISNPNSVNLIGVSVAEHLMGCDVVGDFSGLVVPAATADGPGTLKVDVSCTFDSAADRTNEATIEWAKSAYVLAGRTEVSGLIDFGEPDPITDATLDVTDDKTTGTQSALFTAVATDSSTWSKSYPVTFTAPNGKCDMYTNVAEAGDLSDTRTVTVCGAAEVTADKSATGAYNRAWTWTIAKAAASDTVYYDHATGKATADYTVTVTPTVSDTGATVTGSITVHNPNNVDLEMTVADEMLGKACVITTSDRVAPANDDLVVGYSCTLDTVPTGVVTNTATVSWSKTEYVPAGSLSPTKDVDFGAVIPTVTSGGSITVFDEAAGWTDDQTVVNAPEPSQSGVGIDLTYSHDWSVAPGTCTVNPNTATIVETGAADDAVVEACRGTDLVVTKTASGSYDRDYNWKIEKSVTPVGPVAAGTMVDFPYTVEVNKDGYVDSGQTLSGTITVKNPNDWEDVTLTSLLDTPGNGMTCTITDPSDGSVVDPTKVTVDRSSSVTVDYSCTGAASAYTGTNVATATWDAAAAHTPTGTDSGEAGFTMTEHQTDQLITVTDAQANPTELGTLDWNIADQETFYRYTVTHEAPAGTCADFSNTATISTTPPQTSSTTTELCGYLAVSTAKSADGAFHRDWKWAITKDATASTIYVDPATGKATASYVVKVTPTMTDSAAVVSGTVTVTNPNDRPITGVVVTDSIGATTCSVSYPNGTTVPAGGSLTVSYTCSLATVPTGTVTNTAHVTWPASYYIPAGDQNPAATVDFSGVTPSVTGSQSVTFSDPNSPQGTYGPYDGFRGPVTESYTFDWTGTAGSCVSKTNTATLSTGAKGDAVVSVCSALPLTVTKTAASSITRTYKWKIVKSAPNGLTYGPTLASTVTVPYTVTLSPDGYTDSLWSVTGVITVTNPNDWEAVTVKSVTDQLDASIGGTCTVTGGTTAKTLTAKGTAGATATYAYACTLPITGPTGYSGNNTATATWDATAAHTGTTASATGQAAVNFETGAVTKVNQVITVNDQVAGSTAKLLGTVDWFTGIKTLGTGVTGTIGGWVFTYSNTYTVPKNGCVSFTNTASIKETYQKSSVTVQVCGPQQIGDGTIGFWSNPNGQGLIKNGKYTRTLVGTTYVNVCNVGTWLKAEFNVFDDLVANATCAQVAAYVSNVIKAANASGATMNAMLKAQMLAAALNYYYTTVEPTRGAPSGSLSKMVFDITKWSGGFGGATQMTLMQMLKYADLQYVVATKVWYGGNKTIQGLAKDAFQAVNMSRIVVVQILP